MSPSVARAPLAGPERIGRYTLDTLIGAGGMASVYLGCCSGAADFSRVVAIKRMHAQYARDPDFVSRFRDEAWLCARLLHPNIVQTLDVVEWEHELLLVMEYIEGITLQTLRKDASREAAGFPVSIAMGIMIPVLHGLHAAHEAVDDHAEPLNLVHRDFTPHNILVTRDGHAKVLDFGIAKARGQVHATSVGQLSGKFAYLSPEQIHHAEVDRRADIFAAGIVLWEVLAGERLFREDGLSDAAILERVLRKTVQPPSSKNSEVTTRLDRILLKALARNPDERFGSARELALALEAEVAPATASKVEEFIGKVSARRLARMAELHAGVRRRALLLPTNRASAHEVEATLEAAQPERTHVNPVTGRKSRRWLTVAALAATLAGALAYVVPELLRGNAQPAATALATEGVTIPSPVSPRRDSLSAAPITEPAPPSVVKPLAAIDEIAPKPQPVARKSVARPAKGALAQTAAAADKKSIASEKTASSDRCNPPTYLDAEGIRHFKEGCL